MINNTNGSDMADKKTKEDKSKKDLEKKSKGKTLTGKRAAEIVINPRLRNMDQQGRPIYESDTVIIAHARMNPPSKGHQHLVEYMNNLAKEYSAIPILFVTETQGKDNPLSIDIKLPLIQEAFGDLTYICVSPGNNIINMLKSLDESFKNVIWVCGEDRVKDFTRIVENYNNKEFIFENIAVISCGNRNKDSDNLIENISATSLREAATLHDLNTFSAGLPNKLQQKSKQIMEQVNQGMSKYSSNLAEQILNGIVKKVIQDD